MAYIFNPFLYHANIWGNSRNNMKKYSYQYPIPICHCNMPSEYFIPISHSDFPFQYSIPIFHSDIPFLRTDRSRPVPTQNIPNHHQYPIQISHSNIHPDFPSQYSITSSLLSKWTKTSTGSITSPALSSWTTDL